MPETTGAPDSSIRIRGARQNNLKNLDLDLPTGELIVVTGVSGSGKSSLVFDTLFAEGQRRYVETFSPYARQFLDRMDRPQVDRIDGVPPAIAIDQTNPVRTSRSTVGTMTEVNDHLKLLFARAARLACRHCGRPVVRDTATSICDDLVRRARESGDPRLLVTFPVPVPANFSADEVRGHLEAQGYTRILAEREAGGEKVIDVVADRLRAASVERQRLVEAVETALRVGGGRVAVHRQDDDDGAPGAPWRFSRDLHCADCDIHYTDPTPSAFSFNSPLGACDTCRGFGRVIGIDFGLVVPDERKTLRGGAVKPWQTPSFRECQADLVKFAGRAAVPLDVPWHDLTEAQRGWVLEGAPDWTGKWQTQWYGVRHFFDWLESKAYKMHIRVLLSKYRAYTPCSTCQGTRLKPDALLWRIGTRDDADAALRRRDGAASTPRVRPVHADWSDDVLARLPGLSIHDLMLLPIERVRDFFERVRFDGALDEATSLLLDELRSRLRFLVTVGLGYLTLDRQSRTLSGGEVQRINLTTALGTSLVNTLFVLDEPSIGLHPRDMHRVVDVMQRLRSAGNSLVVVEHDPQVMVAADRIIDIGPGPGERGGRIVFNGTPRALMQGSTLTGEYLSGRRQVETPAPQDVGPSTPRLVLRGAQEHNLKGIEVEFPLQRLVVVSGVSGSGKSTLVQDLLYPALCKALGKSSEAPGRFDGLLGADWLDTAAMIDQSPIGKTTRSNPASYVGAFDAIRALFAGAPIARARDYVAGMFSFNAGDGRCPSCGGNGFEHVEMQFLADVYLRCPDCDGRRFRPEVLEVLLTRGDPGNPRALSIADVLDLTVTEAIAYFAADRDVVRALAPLADVGLEYVKLGQPVPTLSGGEAQRLKIAGFLAEAARSGARGTAAAARVAGPRRAGKRIAGNGSLLLFDEPTTGLHFDDVARLMRALRKLLAAGHSLIVIEHNLDVIRAADWIIDLGPEGGDEGGELVAAGPPARIAADARSHTGAALRDYERQLAGGAPPPATAGAGHTAAEPVDGAYLGAVAGRGIRIHNAREHNLKGIDVTIPRETFTVITGVSGSGKSTLAFDILFNEGQRRYLESLNAYARSLVQPAGRPDVDAIHGIPPTVAIEQRTSRGGRKSTVATLTEVYHFLRLLYVRLGTQHCPDCGSAVTPQSYEAIAAQILRDLRGKHVGLLAPLIVNRKGLYGDLAKWAANKGCTHLRVDGEFVPTSPWPRLDRFREHTIEMPIGDLVVDPRHEEQLRNVLARTLDYGHGIANVVWPLQRLRDAIAGTDATPLEHRVFSTKRACPNCGTSFPEPDPRLFSYNSKHGWCASCFGTGLALQGFDAEQSGEEASWNVLYEGPESRCSACDGQRLNPVALAVRWQGRSIAQLAALPIGEARDVFGSLKLAGRDAEIARDVVTEIRGRLDFLMQVGLGYLTLDRAAPTLSGGEAQRIRLAAQLGSNLRGVCYILDEPTIGLHPRDNRILLDALATLEAKGNTLVVVEHDEETIRRAHHVIDIGPGAGRAGGRIVASGSVAEIVAAPDSITGRYLREPLRHPLGARRPVERETPRIVVRQAQLHNLQRIDAQFALGRLNVVTGVSGSGKSSLARDVLLANLQRAVAATARRGRGAGKAAPAGVEWSGCAAIDGWQAVDRVLEVDQAPIGKTPRSCPATYVGLWDTIRRLYADAFESRVRGYAAGRFSFNTAGGRCDACEGQGVRTIEMRFLPDVKLVCDACGGQRFNAETLGIKLRERSIGDVLAMEVDQALEFFGASPGLAHPLRLLQSVGLGYLTLGQPSPTLSGGEAQRIKLVTELAKVRDDPARRGQRAPHTLYVLDEPTVGLSMADVEKLIRVLQRLVDAGNTAVVIEHNLDVIAEADWIVDLGPEGGTGGGRIAGEAAPEDIARLPTHTGAALREFLAARGRENPA
ncbi:MAG TPA: excinuclease ABC subunit UvrA [Burkholderiaceae bacterium]|nr:excinuclease ABC subunit UvrA [Burkholderiaceae bacterium]